MKLMKAKSEFDKLVEDAYEEDLQSIILHWAREHAEFKSYVEGRLAPDVEDMDFADKLRRSIAHETNEFFSRHDIREATDWGSVYYDKIEPWSENADTLSTEKLTELIDVIVREVGMRITDEDFYGDDWYGDDFSGNISDIMAILADLVGHLVTREDLSDMALNNLKELILTAQKTMSLTAISARPIPLSWSLSA